MCLQNQCWRSLYLSFFVQRHVAGKYNALTWGIVRDVHFCWGLAAGLLEIPKCKNTPVQNLYVFFDYFGVYADNLGTDGCFPAVQEPRGFHGHFVPTGLDHYCVLQEREHHHSQRSGYQSSWHANGCIVRATERPWNRDNWKIQQNRKVISIFQFVFIHQLRLLLLSICHPGSLRVKGSITMVRF